jgi:Na+-driven multidrug efflux pump
MIMLKAINTLYIFFFLASIVLSATGIIFSERIFRLTKLPEDVMPHAKVYFNIICPGIVVFFGFNGTSAILRGLGDSKTPLYFLVISSFFNILLDLLFVIVFKWGVAGAAYATIISHMGAFITAIIYLNRIHKLININFLRLKFDRKIFFQSVRLCIPAGFQQTFVAIGMIALFRVVNEFGTEVTYGDTLIPMFMTLISLWIIRIPLAVFLSGIIDTDGIWWSAPASWLTGMLFSFLSYLTGKWKSKVVIEKVMDPNLMSPRQKYNKEIYMLISEQNFNFDQIKICFHLIKIFLKDDKIYDRLR